MEGERIKISLCNNNKATQLPLQYIHQFLTLNRLPVSPRGTTDMKFLFDALVSDDYRSVRKFRKSVCGVIIIPV